MSAALSSNRSGGAAGARSMVEGALFAALASLFAIASLAPPLFFLALAIPVPLTVVGYRYGIRAATLSAVVAVGLTFILSGSPVTVGLVLSSGAAGLAIAYGIRRGWPAMRIVLLATLTSLVSWVVEFFFSLWVMGLNIWKQEVRLNQEGLKQGMEFQRQLVKKFPGTVRPEDLKQLEMSSKWFTHILPMLWPFMIVGSSFTAGVVDYGIIRGSFRRLKLGEVPGFPAFKTWRLPEWTGWMGLAAFGAGYAQSVWPSRAMELVALNLLFLSLFAFLIEGLAVSWYYFDKWGVDKFTRTLIAVFAFMIPVGAIVLLAIGFLDIFLDYRQPREG